MSHLKQDLPFLPENSTWEDWNGNVILYFGEEPLPYLPEDEWRNFGKAFISLPTFTSFALPNPDEFINWKDWAQAIVVAVNGVTQ